MSMSLFVPEILAVKLERCRKSHPFLNVFALPNFKGAVPPPKLYPRYHPHLAARHVAKFYEATPPSSKVRAANTLHFISFEKCCKGSLRPGCGVR